VTVLFDRKVRVQVDEYVIEELDVAFEIVKSLSAQTPNSAEIRIWNLNAEHRKRLQELEKVYVSLEAGYVGGTSLLFRGDLRDVLSTREGSEWITTVTSDSGRLARKRRILKSFAPGATVQDVLTAAAKAMGVRLGNTAAKTVSAKIQGTQASKFFNGYALAGAIEGELDRLARSCGLEWSIQEDELQFLDQGKPLQELGIELTPDTGLIGSPEPGNKGITEARCLMIPDLFPGRRIRITSEHVTGIYRAETTKHTGNTAERDWYVDLELRNEERKR
jgi:hypothetical protein